ncbi:MAG TPA: hypothetical protein VI636_02840 [Candidatus Angelobacter sp.]
MAKKEYREYKLRIHGMVNGEEITPLTLPMAKLADYLEAYASLLGYRENVHFLKVEGGSASPVALVEMERDSQVRERIKQAANDIGPKDALDAYKKLNTILTEDNGYGEILERVDTREVTVIEFPGNRRNLSPIYGPIKESAFLQGLLRRVGGKEPTVPVHLVDVDGKEYFCWARKELILQLRHYVFQQVRLYGMATWVRDANAKWNLEQFEVQSFTADLTEDSPSTVFAELRAVPGNEWNELADPLEELRKIRHGEDKVQ